MYVYERVCVCIYMLPNFNSILKYVFVNSGGKIKIACGTLMEKSGIVRQSSSPRFFSCLCPVLKGLYYSLLCVGVSSAMETVSPAASMYLESKQPNQV